MSQPSPRTTRPPTSSSSRRARRAPSATTWAPARSRRTRRSSSTSCRATTRRVYTDMTRTFVLGDVPDDVREWHRLVKEALDRAIAETKPGVEGRALFDGPCEIFEAAGEPTQRTKTPGEPLERRLLPRARPRRRARGARGAGPRPARRRSSSAGRRHHGRAGPLPRRVRRRPARGQRPRHRDRRREPDGYPYDLNLSRYRPFARKGPPSIGSGGRRHRHAGFPCGRIEGGARLTDEPLSRP